MQANRIICEGITRTQALGLAAQFINIEGIGTSEAVRGFDLTVIMDASPCAVDAKCREIRKAVWELNGGAMCTISGPLDLDALREDMNGGF